ncbi:MAG: hypothetical protein KAW66_12650 [Candidatus Lokiarchaeota archaeon]|nr:hypothetical protein [Candidatus Lokiarchaeota archaeon]
MEETTILIKFQYIINLFEYNQKLLTISKSDTLKNKITEVEQKLYKYSVSIRGTGFIGLCSAACFADKDIKVFGSTHNEN